MFQSGGCHHPSIILYSYPLVELASWLTYHGSCYVGAAIHGTQLVRRTLVPGSRR